MTLLPSDVFGITGHPGNAYKVQEICSVPGCGKWSAHAHHIWPRSYIRKDYDWVKLPTGEVLGNRTGMCVEHHEQVTGQIGGYKARIVWDAGILWWETKTILRVAGDAPPYTVTGTDWERIAPLDPQPPLGDMEASRKHANDHEGLSDGEVCPRCGHHKKPSADKAREEPKVGKPRKTKEWTVIVPDDAEIGADILDGWIEDLAIPLQATEWSLRQKRYHVLSVALAFVSIHREEFIADVAEAAERTVADG